MSAPTTSPRPDPVLSRDRDASQLRRAVRDGELVRLRRGAYVPADVLTGDGRAARRALATATAVSRQLTTEHWLSHASAAAVWGLPLVDPVRATHLIQGHRPGGRRDRAVVRHLVGLPAAERATHLGLPVTTLERTVVDCASALSGPAALAVADAALRRGASAEVMAGLVRARPGPRGVVQARQVVARADGRSESPGESVARWYLLASGLPAPVPQCPVHTHAGIFFADLGWPDLHVALEFDGLVKYSGRYGDPTAALLAEKRRQDAMQEAGWRLVRLVWADLADPTAVARRVRAALQGAPGIAGS
jgi:hypothetical protein